MMITNLKGRIKNTSLPKSNANLALLEVIVNSIHAIDERISKIGDISINDGKIVVRVLRDVSLVENGELIGFEVVDNGIGFNDNNYESFNTLDTDYKHSLGCHGIGRLIWLKVFNEAHIESSFIDKGAYYKRKFSFTENGISNHSPQLSSESFLRTSVQLRYIRDNYLGSFPSKPTTIAKQVLEHCMWFFMRDGSAPNIVIEDGDESINLNNEYDEYMLSSTNIESFTLKGKEFNLTHIKLKHTKDNSHWLYYCAANRIVVEKKLEGKIPGLFDILHDESSNQDFYYCCYVTSSFLTDSVNETRVAFDIAESNDGVFSECDDVTFDEINNAAYSRVSSFLSPYLEVNIELSRTFVEKFVSEKAPRYKSILKRIPDSELVVNPKISEKDLEIKLHSHLMKVESELISEGHDLMKPMICSDEDDYLKRIHKYLDKAIDLKQSDLANYVVHRKVIIDLLRDLLKRKSNGSYSTEDMIHQLIMPMQKDSEDVEMDASNLWLIDERLAFHSYLASDKPLRSMPVLDNTCRKEPDIFALNVYDNPLLINDGQMLPLASLTVVEFKRPMRNDAKEGESKDPIEQVLAYVKMIRQGDVHTKDGRIIPNADNIPAFCYIICDLTSTIVERCDMHDLILTSDKMGYFGYQKKYNAYVEVLSFDRLVNQASQRNRAYFDKLGLPTN